MKRRRVAARFLIVIGVVFLFWLGYAIVWNISSGYGVNLLHTTVMWRGMMIFAIGALSIFGGYLLEKKGKSNNG